MDLYTGEEIRVLGSIVVTAETKGQQARLPFLVAGGSSPSLMDHDWLAKLHLNWREIFSMCVQHTLTNILEQHQRVFKQGLGTINGMEAKLMLIHRPNQPSSMPALYH